VRIEGRVGPTGRGGEVFDVGEVEVATDDGEEFLRGSEKNLNPDRKYKIL
jgi:hypothetical protein